MEFSMASQISIPFSDVLGIETTSDILGNISDIIDETFLFTGDEDYLSARFLAFNQQHRAFYWSAAQCLEKYCKATLLLFGVPVKDFSHDIERMFQEIKKHDERFSNVALTLPNQLNEIKEFWGSKKVGGFINIISKYGHPDNRYDYIGISFDPSTLFKLDQLVYLLRNRITDRGLCAHTKLEPEMATYLFNNNFSFAPDDFEHSSIYDMKVGFRLTSTKLERALNNCYGHEQIYKTWLNTNVKIKVNDNKFKN
jgi:hypothetical protein